MKTKYWHIFATDTNSGKEHEVGTGKYTSKEEAEGAFKTLADNEDNKLVNPSYRCYSMLSLLRTKCKTKSQRRAYNELVKSFSNDMNIFDKLLKFINKNKNESNLLANIVCVYLQEGGNPGWQRKFLKNYKNNLILDKILEDGWNNPGLESLSKLDELPKYL